MQRRSSGSSDDGDNPPANVKIPDARLSASHDPDARSTAPGLQSSPRKVDRRASADLRPSSARSRRSGNFNWKLPPARNGSIEKDPALSAEYTPATPGAIVTGARDDDELDDMEKVSDSRPALGRRPGSRNPWAITILTLVVSVLGIACLATVLKSAATRHIDPKGCRMSYMRPSYAKLEDFDTEHTRFASKYSLYLYREQGIDDDTKVRENCARNRAQPCLYFPLVLLIICRS